VLNSHSFGLSPRITIFGQSHDPEIGVLIEKLPAGLSLDMDNVTSMLQRRKPGQGALTTARSESDKPCIGSGLDGGVTTGSLMRVTFANTDTRKGDYQQFASIPRPSHADYLAMTKYGEAHDMAGGGRFSGRLTLPLCFAGAICLQILNEQNITVRARLAEVGGQRENLDACIMQARDDHDSVGGIVELAATGLPAGVGEHPFGGVEPVLSQLLFAIPGVRGVEFGAGFGAAAMRGSAHNDAWVSGQDNTVQTATNHAGGVIGGMTTGMNLRLRVAFKPTPSISKAQETLNLDTGQQETLTVKGRHDPCIAVRAVPVVEAMVAIGLLNLINTDSQRFSTRSIGDSDSISDIRSEIDHLDDELAQLFAQRMTLVDRIDSYKTKTDTPVYDPAREQAILSRLTAGMDFSQTEALTSLYQKVFEISRGRQSR
jgi:chorismate synthase